MHLDDATIEEARRLNSTLSWAPRFRVRNRVGPMAMQALLRVSQIGADRRMRRAGLSVETRRVEMEGLRVPVRILRPAGAVRGVVLDFHGGGWVMGNARMDDRLNAAMIQACEVAVVSVDYRLLLRAPLPAVMRDCVAAARWLLQGGLADCAGLPVILTGESAGGHLAAATLLQLKAWPELLRRVAGAVLYYGVYDLTGTASVRQAGPETLVLHGPSLHAAMGLLLPGQSEAARRTPPLSPLYGDLSGMPPALMFAGTLDPLRDDTLQLALRWRNAAEVELHLVPEAPHGYIHFRTRMAGATLVRTHEWVRARLQRSGAGPRAQAGTSP